ncbi:blue light photoreceptor protein [Cryphonectria parasitica EP155]|uniref:Cryptochrome DASH n=1 Tax=Cryphonectria parasitica (strain ATCC 38755 / EP155) TaxID=660469 RepID=A0A9P5CT84_CRYP1|nr:blue light photoreceptor protein [Cryphonectria parasitica EP155]KAF3769397.1 blue light photoreceptor protein [Cryphonectria parasitica EP155]
MVKSNILIYVLRHDLRLSDNPIFHRLASQTDHGFTHLLPVYVFPAQQIEVSGFIKDGAGTSPYPEARSTVYKVWRTGPHRAKFIAQSVWDLKEKLESAGAGLVLRVGNSSDVVADLITGFSRKEEKVGAVWMTKDEGVEECREQKAISAICKEHDAAFKLWTDEKYYVDDRDLSTPIKDIPDVFTTYRKSVEPLRSRPRAVLPKPDKGQLPPLPEASCIPPQQPPFTIPTEYAEVEEAVVSPVRDFLSDMPAFPEGAESAHPFSGGESSAQERLHHLIKEGLMYSYKETRNGLLGPAFSTKLSAYLAQGCLTARQIHHEMLKYEDGTDVDYEHAKGFKEGENEGTAAVRFELLWRDYMRLCTMKFRHRLFRLDGFRGRDEKYDSEAPTGATTTKKPKWKTSIAENALADQQPGPDEVAELIRRFNNGTTGMGLIDASQRELLHTGYTSNRSRQNVASFLAKHLGIDWRFGAEWYEMLLLDYDVSSNWANWQYVAGVGNDPRGEARIFNPVKQAFDYDKQGAYVKTWVPELQPLQKLENIFQVSTTSPQHLEEAGLTGNIMATNPVKRIEFVVDGKPKSNRRPFLPRGRGARRGYNGSRHMHTNDGPGMSSSSGNPDSDDYRGPPYRGRGGGFGMGPRRGFHSGRGRGAFHGGGGATAYIHPQAYFAGPQGQMGAPGQVGGGYHMVSGQNGYPIVYPNLYAAGPPPS